MNDVLNCRLPTSDEQLDYDNIVDSPSITYIYALTGIVSNSCNLMGNLEYGNSDKFMHYSTSLITVSSSCNFVIQKCRK